MPDDAPKFMVFLKSVSFCFPSPVAPLFRWGKFSSYSSSELGAPQASEPSLSCFGHWFECCHLCPSVNPPTLKHLGEKCQTEWHLMAQQCLLNQCRAFGAHVTLGEEDTWGTLKTQGRLGWWCKPVPCWMAEGAVTSRLAWCP